MYVQYEKFPHRRHAKDLYIPSITSLISDINIDIKEVDSVIEDDRSPLNLSNIVISHVDHKDWI